MADYFDKLRVETSIKLAFPGIDIKEIKQSASITVEELTRRRIEILPSDPCAAGVHVDAITVPDIGKSTFAMIVVKLARLDANKGIQPLFVANAGFLPVEADKMAFKLEGEGSVTFWKPAAPRFEAPAGPIFVFNPNKSNVILDIHYGITK